MREIREYNMNGIRIILGVDNGYGNVKPPTEYFLREL